MFLTHRENVGKTVENREVLGFLRCSSFADAEARSYRVRSLRIFGGIQIGVGALCAILSLVGVVIDSIKMNKHCDYSYYNYNYDQYRKPYRYCYDYHNAGTLFAFDITCLIFSGWNFMTGMFPFCMNQKRKNSWRCLKITYMVCSIVGAAVFMPTVFSLGVVGAIIRGEYGGGIVALPAFLAVLGMIEMIVSIVASSYCCCCSSFGNTERTRIVYVTTQQPGMWLNIPQTQIPNQQFQVPAAIPMTTTQTNNQAISATAQQYQVPTGTAQQYQVPTSATAQQYQMPTSTTPATHVHPTALADSQPPPYKQ